MQYFEFLISWQRKKNTRDPKLNETDKQKQKETKVTKMAKCYYYLIKLAMVAFQIKTERYQ